MQLEEHLFRREAGRIVVALTRLFGLERLSLAEDVVQDALIRAIEVWRFQGIPENPSAWLMTTAKNRAMDILRRERTARTFAPRMSQHLDQDLGLGGTTIAVIDDCFDPNAIRDEQLKMMFSCCDARLGEEAQVALILHILCGFSVAEIAQAFLASPAAVKKRITRAKALLASAKETFRFASGEVVEERLDAVQRALYLLFNEGFHGASDEALVRGELCGDAMRLTSLLLDQPASATSSSRALLALMCFHGARLSSRIDDDGNLYPLHEQDRSKWDRRLIAQGQELMDQAAAGTTVSAYHIEATIAAAHCAAADAGSTDWKTIVLLYDLLLTVRPSPVVALQRAIAIGQLEGPTRGLEEIEAISDRDRLNAYPFFEAALGELHLRAGNEREARDHFQAAAQLARNRTERRYFTERIV